MPPAVLESKPGLSSSPLTDSAQSTKLHALHRCSSRPSAGPTSAQNLLCNALLLIATAANPSILHAQNTPQNKLYLDTGRSEVHFTLISALHTVHGTFQIQQGDIAFNPATGQANGSIVVDALSGKSGNSIRDRRMTNDELKAPDYKTIAFAPARFTGTFNPAGDSTLQVHGIFTLLGTPHEIDVPMQVQVNGDKIHAVGSFTVPYVQWGLKDPSSLMIHVNKEVHVDLDLSGTLRH
jgi:polyisoprenoid-binding protein YceI